MSARNLILLNGEAREEGIKAAAQLIPGMLCRLTTGGTLAVHNVDGGTAAPVVFVREQHELEGNGIGDAIASGDTCTAIYPTMGARINAITDDTIASQGVPLASNGDGTLRIAVPENGDVTIAVSGGPSVAEGTRLRVPAIIGAAQNIIGSGFSL